ncbi:unnamed protein product [Diabrotica balteata]|uniref:Uncharacterized protein n=1 Tax=Diabrotica balteata TaxID=107213 RepID=A0A9N9XE98_DIABA|nr:unnamed protein product [Diabrotica balteata]
MAEKSLSRKRRYLTFPSGSSLQLVYCLTIPSVGVGAIYTFGLTAALAWELPSTGDELLIHGVRSFNNERDNSYVHPVYHQIHRRTRRDLYVKLEKLMTALSKDGKACLKKAICEVSQVPPGKGTLYQELMKTIFRIKPHDDYEDEDDYDRAANKSHNCSERYSSCQHSVWTDMF